jgi:two-component system response regulator NreC
MNPSAAKEEEMENTVDMEHAVRVLLADDHAAVRLGLKTLMEKDPAMEVVGEASNGEELVRLLKKHECDVVVTDLSMPGMDGIEVLEEVRANYPDVRVLILSMHQDREMLKKAVSKGVDGYLLKNEVLENIIDAVKKIHAGNRVYSEALKNFIIDDYTSILENQSAENSLTQREREILSRVAKGSTNKQIADELTISVRTVEAHRSRIMNKLGLKKVQDLVRFAIAKGLI